MKEEELREQKEVFLSLLRDHVKRDGIEGVISFLDHSDFFVAPASTKYHGNYDGGLCEHSMNVYHNLIKLRDQFFPDYNTEENEETLAIVALLHDVCKINCYQPTQKNVKKKNPDGTFVYVNGRPQWEEVWGFEWNEKIPLGHGEKSCILIQYYMKLTVEELLAIRWHMGTCDHAFKGGDTGLYKAQEMYQLVTYLQMADTLDASIVSDEEGA